MNSEGFAEMLEILLIAYGENLIGSGLIFQQNSAATHNFRITKDWCTSKNIDVMECPARSLDLNSFQKSQGILARRVFGNGKQLSTVNELKNAIRTEWSNISSDVGQLD